MVVEAPTRERRLLEDLEGERWHAKSGAALALGIGWYAIHIGVAYVVSLEVGRALGQPVGWSQSITWFLLLCGVATATLHATQRLGRRLIPLRTLLRLSLAFPGTAPSRYAIAFRAGNPRFLQRRVRHANEHGIGSEPDAAAVSLLELVAALSRHDRALRGHSERVRAYTELVAEELGLDRGARDGLRWAGLMHDVGKLEIPSAILNKAGPLTVEEWRLIRTHPRIGARLCAPLEPWLGEWTAAVLDHHERWDGRGYPRRLASSDISLAGRIVAVADAFDVMTSARSYKRPCAAEDALEEIARCSGTQFDPNVVAAFLAIPVRRFRAVMGPAGAWVQRPFGWSWTRVVETIGGPLVAIAVASAVALLGPVLSTPSSRSTTPAPSATSAPSRPAVAPRTRVEAVEIDREGDATNASAPGTASSTAPSTVDVPATVPPTVRDTTGTPSDDPAGGSVGDGAGGGDPSLSDGPTTAPPPPGPPSVADPTVVVDPSSGSIAVEGISPAPDVEATVPGAGDVACGAAGACEPVRVTVPGTGL